jgi:hypothetical protein
MVNIIIVGGKGRRETVLQVTEAAKGYNQLAMKGLRTLSALACCRNDLHRPSHLGPGLSALRRDGIGYREQSSRHLRHCNWTIPSRRPTAQWHSFYGLT